MEKHPIQGETVMKIPQVTYCFFEREKMTIIVVCNGCGIFCLPHIQHYIIFVTSDYGIF